MTETLDAGSSLREQQFALARHVRDPDVHPPPPGIEERRLKIYRELFFNSIEGLLAGNFPVARTTLGDDIWRALVRRFYAEHHCRTPLFTEIAREFVQYLQQRQDAGADDPPWLAELAHYEWVELALQISDAEPPADNGSGANPGQALLDGAPVVSPLAWPLAYRWPVHRIGPDYRPDRAPDAATMLLVRRDDEGDVRFSELSPLLYRLLQLLGENTDRSGRQVLETLADEACASDIDAFIAEGHTMLQRLGDEGTVLGAVPL